MVLRPRDARATDPSVTAVLEAALPPGTLPAWETQAERSRPRVRPPVSPLPSPPPAPPAPGFRVPAEFEPVAAFLVTEGDWQDGSWGSDVQMLIDMIERGTTAGGAGAIVMTRGSVASYESYLSGKGVDLSRVHVVHATAGLDAKWARDFGPISVYDGDVAGHLGFVDMHYYDARPEDDAVAGQLASVLGIARYGLEGNDHSPPDAAKLYMEGGNFMTDGQGTCILSNDIPSDNAKNGNTQADTLPEVEALLKTYLNCQKIIWLQPMPNNSTGHVDMYAKLLTPTDILMIDFPNQTGANGEADAVVEANVEVMQAATNLQGQPFNVHRVTVSSLSSSTWIYRTYTNSTILNRVVLVPTYASSYDDAALQAYRDVLGPEYTVTPIDASSIVAMGGAVHCTTMQIASACGDGKAETLLFESCDGDDLGGATCESLGFAGGQLACRADCTYDTTGCGPTVETDGGADAEVGADAQADGGVQQDGEAVDSGADAAVGEDARASVDAAADPPDAEPVPGADLIADNGGGCSCGVAGTSDKTMGGWVLVAMAGVAASLRLSRRRIQSGNNGPCGTCDSR